MGIACLFPCQWSREIYQPCKSRLATPCLKDSFCSSERGLALRDLTSNQPFSLMVNVYFILPPCYCYPESFMWPWPWSLIWLCLCPSNSLPCHCPSWGHSLILPERSASSSLGSFVIYSLPLLSMLISNGIQSANFLCVDVPLLKDYSVKDIYREVV